MPKSFNNIDKITKKNYNINVDSGHINVDNNVSTTVTNKPSVSLDEPIDVRVTNMP